MIRATLLSSRRSIWVMTLTSGLRASMVSRADSALYCPMRLVLCKIWRDRKSTRLNSSHSQISYAVFCLKKKIHNETHRCRVSICILNCLEDGVCAICPMINSHLHRYRTRPALNAAAIYDLQCTDLIDDK